jgi:uracil-DNA glycosylase family 4
VKEKPAACRGCPAFEYGLGFVPPTQVLENTQFAVIGQGPGEQEALFGEPFYARAPSGRTLRGWFSDAGIDLQRVAFANIVQCWLPKKRISGELGKDSRPPTEAEASFCYEAHLRPWLESLPDAHWIAVGAPATRFLLDLPQEKPAEQLAGVTHRKEFPRGRRESRESPPRAGA